MGRITYALLVAFVSIAVYVSTTHAGLSKDLPDPPSKMRTFGANSLVMPMDNKQLVSGQFNVKTYGLAVQLLWGEIPLYWSIRAGKLKDARDFTANAQQIYPTTESVANTDFFAGPFVILPSYFDRAMTIVRNWQGGRHSVVIYRLAGDTNIDVRHEIFIKPKILISTLSSAYTTQTNILNAAGLVAGSHYILSDNAANTITDLNAQSCFTFFSEPHYSWKADQAPAYYDAVRSFVVSGGNFLAQCAGVESYENWNPGFRGGFQALAGLYTKKFDNVVDLMFENPDTPYSQFLGPFNGKNSGHTPDYCWSPPASLNLGTTQVNPGDEKAWLINNAYYVVHNNPAVAKCNNGQTSVVASVSKPGQGQGIGGLVFYLPAHDWSQNGADYDAGRRLYLNALITPATRNQNCGFNFCPPGEECPAGDTCSTCRCDANGQPQITRNPTCCLVSADCGPCSPCVNNQCQPACPSDGTNSCSVCNTDTNRCDSISCGCTSDDQCLPCSQCVGPTGSKQCTPIEGCCQGDSDCGSCGYCDTSRLITPSRAKPHYICQTTPNCCAGDEDCTDACTSCVEGVCTPSCDACTPCLEDGETCGTASEDCCYNDAACGTCQVCDLGNRVCIDCPACTECDGTVCAPIEGCCTASDQCGVCEACTDNACVSTVDGELGSCCTSDEDCTAEGTVCSSFSVCATSCSDDTDCGDCENCIDDVCQASSQCEDKDGDGDGDSPASRLGLFNTGSTPIINTF